MQIAAATPTDVAEIAAIYAHHVVNSTASYEIAPPDQTEMAARLVRVQSARP